MPESAEAVQLDDEDSEHKVWLAGLERRLQELEQSRLETREVVSIVLGSVAVLVLLVGFIWFASFRSSVTLPSPTSVRRRVAGFRPLSGKESVDTAADGVESGVESSVLKDITAPAAASDCVEMPLLLLPARV